MPFMKGHFSGPTKHQQSRVNRFHHKTLRSNYIQFSVCSSIHGYFLLLKVLETEEVYIDMSAVSPSFFPYLYRFRLI